jgi:hypothetical protein
LATLFRKFPCLAQGMREHYSSLNIEYLCMTCFKRGHYSYGLNYSCDREVAMNNVFVCETMDGVWHQLFCVPSVWVFMPLIAPRKWRQAGQGRRKRNALFSDPVLFCSELSSGMYCRVKWLSTDVSEVRTASIIRDEYSFITASHRRYRVRICAQKTTILIMSLHRPSRSMRRYLQICHGRFLPLSFPFAFRIHPVFILLHKAKEVPLFILKYVRGR